MKKIITLIVILVSTFFTSTLHAAFYSIESKMSGKALDVENGSRHDTANIQQWSYNGGNHQIWSLEAVGSYYKIVSLNSGRCLDVWYGETTNGTHIQQYEFNGQNWQLWDIIDVGGGYVKIVSVNSGLCLDVRDFNPDDGARIQQYEYWGGDNQKWLLTERSAAGGARNYTRAWLIDNSSNIFMLTSSLDTIMVPAGADNVIYTSLPEYFWVRGGENETLVWEHVGYIGEDTGTRWNQTTNPTILYSVYLIGGNYYGAYLAYLYAYGFPPALLWYKL